MKIKTTKQGHLREKVCLTSLPVCPSLPRMLWGFPAGLWRWVWHHGSWWAARARDTGCPERWSLWVERTVSSCYRWDWNTADHSNQSPDRCFCFQTIDLIDFRAQLLVSEEALVPLFADIIVTKELKPPSCGSFLKAGTSSQKHVLTLILISASQSVNILSPCYKRSCWTRGSVLSVSTAFKNLFHDNDVEITQETAEPCWVTVGGFSKCGLCVMFHVHTNVWDVRLKDQQTTDLMMWWCFSLSLAVWTNNMPSSTTTRPRMNTWSKTWAVWMG